MSWIKHVLLFDEVSISRGLSYDVKEDHVLGFVNDGVSVKPKFSDHALVFMLRGIRRKWKQVVAHVFVEHSLKKYITFC